MVTVCMVLCSQGPTQLFVVSSTASQQTAGWVPGECCSYLTRLGYNQVWCCTHIHCLFKGLTWACDQASGDLIHSCSQLHQQTWHILPQQHYVYCVHSCIDTCVVFTPVLIRVLCSLLYRYVCCVGFLKDVTCSSCMFKVK